MKKNIILSAILVALLTATYFLQEKSDERNFFASLSEGRLLQEELKEIKLPHLEAQKKEGRWWKGDQLLSQNTMRFIEKKLGEVKSIKSIEGDPKNYFSDPLEIEVNGVPWKIGDMSLDRQAFYIAQGDKIHLAIIDGESTGTSTSEEEIEAGKLNELKGQLTKSYEALIENQLFRYYPDLPMERVMVDADGNLPFELLLEENKTLPPPIEGISVHQDLKGKFISVLTQVTLKKEIPFDESLKFKKLSIMTFSGKGEEIIWEVWIKSQDSGEAFLFDNKKKKAYQMVGGSLKPFFIQVQDYWDKKVIPPKAFKPFKRLPIKLTQGSKEALVTVIDREPLDFEAEKYKVKPGNMQDLLRFIFNLGERDQAARVSQLTSSDKKQYLGEENLQLEVMGQELLCVRKRDEMILANLTQGFKAHFLSPPENLNCRFEDVLE